MRLTARSWVFRVSAGIVLGVIWLIYSINIYWHIRNISVAGGIFSLKIYKLVSFWPGTDLIPSSMPCENVIITTIFFSAIVVIMAAQSMWRETYLDTIRPIHSKPVSNLVYMAGKSAGIIVIFMTMTFLALIPTFILNILRAGTTTDISGYIVYPFLIALPAFIFISGITTLISSIFGGRATGFLAVIPMIVLSLLFAGGPISSILDIFGWYTPLMSDPITGFSNTTMLIVKRFFFIFAGLSFFFLSTAIFKREVQSRLLSRVSIVMAALMFTGSAALAFHSGSLVYRGRRIRKTMRSLDNEASAFPVVEIENSSIFVRHEGDHIECRAALAVRNHDDVDMDRYLLTLNSGLEVTKVTSTDGTLEYSRNLHHLWVDAGDGLAPGTADTVDIFYSGRIDEETCYLFATEDERSELKRRTLSIDPTVSGKRYAYISDDFLLLTPEVHWYPASGARYDDQRPELCKNDFSTFSVEYSGREGLVPASQGTVTKTGDGKYRFTPSNPLTGISLIAGEFRHRSVQVDSTGYNSYTFKKLDRFDRYIYAVADTLPDLIRDMRERIESDSFLPYPFRKFALVQIPSDFSSHSNPLWPGYGADFQPEILMVPTDNSSGYMNLDRVFRNAKWYLGQDLNRTPSQKEIQSQTLSLLWILFEERSFFYQRNLVNSGDIPVLGKALDSYIALSNKNSLLNHYLDPKYHTVYSSRLRPIELASRYLDGKSLEDLLHSPSRIDSMAMAVTAKGVSLFTMLEALAGGESLKTILTDIFESEPFTVIEMPRLVATLNKSLGIDIQPVIDAWYSQDDLPGFIFSDIRLSRSLLDEHTIYNLRLKVFNPEKVDGIFVIDSSTKKEKIYSPFIVEAGRAKEFGIIFHSKPRSSIMIYTLISRNLPNRMRLNSRNIIKDDLVGWETVFEGERFIDPPRKATDTDIIVVDNEDSRFEILNKKQNRLRTLLPWIKDVEARDGYVHMRNNNFPARWTPCLEKRFYGDYVSSACFIGAGQGKNRVAWNCDIQNEGWYDVYAYMTRMTGMSEKHTREYYNQPYDFSVYHSDGVASCRPVMYEAELGWNLLGRFYYNEGKTRVELSDDCTHGVLVADAVKWVKR